jgi:hypothetical protein
MTKQELKDDPDVFSEFWSDLTQYDGNPTKLHGFWYNGDHCGLMDFLDAEFEAYCEYLAEGNIP